jgi:RHS repeat-associated protein
LVSRLESSTNPNGQTTQYAYDARDFILSTTDALNHVTQFRYDDNGNMLEIENAKGGVTTLGYDDNDFLTSESFGGFTKQYDYDDEGKLTTLTKPDGTQLAYDYDPNTGNLTDDDYATYTYDGRNRLKTVTKDGGTITYGYDDLNRITSISYDGETVSYTYDANSNVTSMTYPGTKIVTYTYDAKDRLETVTDWNNNTTVYTFLLDDRLNTVLYPNGIGTEYEYDNAGRMTKLIHYKSGTPWIRYVFGLDQLGNHLNEQEIDEPFGQPIVSKENCTYTYNSVNRIQSVTGDMGTAFSFSFDDNGNTLTKTGTTYGYDVHDMLTSVTSPGFNAQYAYDGLGNRRTATRNGVTTDYTLDILGMSRVLLEKDAGGAVRNYYVYGLGLISRVKPDGDTRYYTYDFRGSTIAMTDDAQTVTHSYNYEDFGANDQVTEEDENLFRYVGIHGVMYESETLQFMRARYYDNDLGRFLSEDPIWSTNIYPYADNNPLSGVDPLGTSPLFLTTFKTVKEFKTAFENTEDFIALTKAAQQDGIRGLVVQGISQNIAGSLVGGATKSLCLSVGGKLGALGLSTGPYAAVVSPVAAVVGYFGCQRVASAAIDGLFEGLTGDDLTAAIADQIIGPLYDQIFGRKTRNTIDEFNAEVSAYSSGPFSDGARNFIYNLSNQIRY